MIKVSASIVTYNNVKYIEKAAGTLLDSVKDENIDFRLYVFDNGSTDGTVELLKEKFGGDPRFFLHESKDNIGFGKAHNRMLKVFDDFRADYHCVVNPDVVIKDDIVSMMTDYCEQHRDVVLLSPRICFPDGRNQILGKRRPHIWYLAASRLRGEKPSRLLSYYAMLNADYSKPFEIKNATGCFMFFRGDTFREIGGFDDRYFMYFEDCDIVRTIGKKGKVLFFPNAVVYHVWARDSKRNFRLKMIHIQSMIKYDLKWRTI